MRSASATVKLLIGSKMDSRPPGRSTRENWANAACLVARSRDTPPTPWRCAASRRALGPRPAARPHQLGLAAVDTGPPPVPDLTGRAHLAPRFTYLVIEQSPDLYPGPHRRHRPTPRTNTPPTPNHAIKGSLPGFDGGVPPRSFRPAAACTRSARAWPCRRGHP